MSAQRKIILGIDEVGRGPLAGPLVVGAVILPEYTIDSIFGFVDEGPEWISELKDSKQLSAKRREFLRDIIVEKAPACGLGWVKIEELNEIGIMEGLKLATRRAVEMVREKHVKFTEVVIDGNMNFLEDTTLGPYTTTVIKGDDKVKEVSAASIIAKVARDKYMMELADVYPQYSFERNMGYGTQQHLKALREYGICEEHRLFCAPVARAAGIKKVSIDKGYYKRRQKNTSGVGYDGETAVCDYLMGRGHTILERNYKNKYCEIDVISIYGNKIYFTEVKTRKSGNGLDAIDLKKLNKMKFAANMFLQDNDIYKSLYDPMLAAASVDGNFRVKKWVELD